MNLVIKLALAGALGFVPVAGAAQEMKSGPLTIDRPWVRVTIPGRPAGGYMTVRNSGTSADKLLSAASPQAERVELHSSTMNGGIMRMRRVGQIEIPAKGRIELKSGGLHFMIFGLKNNLKKGDKLPLSLVFEKAGTIKIEAEIGGAGGIKMKKKP